MLTATKLPLEIQRPSRRARLRRGEHVTPLDSVLVTVTEGYNIQPNFKSSLSFNSLSL
jgi:hypothetical protein